MSSKLSDRPVRYMGFELSEQEYTALLAQAAKELRTPRDQALHILRTALDLPAPPPTDTVSSDKTE